MHFHDSESKYQTIHYFMKLTTYSPLGYLPNHNSPEITYLLQKKASQVFYHLDNKM